ncbi:MAG TPA: CCA tRNA nucleotidyltransferase [Devosia sp.]|nr:CCA tRNA nucleotidyltransferase [Devosia sp.]
MSLADLARAEWLRRAETQAIFAALDGGEGRTRAVGGVVRDTILAHERTTADIDLATELVPDEVIARAERAGIASYPTGYAHGTVTLKLGDTLAEVTTLRQDIETDGRHAVVSFGTDWTADASRRDFTLNALYCGADGALLDPLNGLEDALARRVRFIGDAGARIAEDGLRVYRFFRFSASHGGERFDPEGLQASRAAAGRLEHISAERVGGEMLRMLALPRIAATLEQMSAIGLLAVPSPSLNTLQTYETLGGRSPASRLLLLAGGDLDDLRARWRLSNETVKAAQAISAAADLVGSGRVGEATYRHGEAAVEGLAVAAARQGWAREFLGEVAREMGRTVVGQFPVSGTDLTGLGLEPGPALGQQLARLERAWIDSGFSLSKRELLDMVGH